MRPYIIWLVQGHLCQEVQQGQQLSVVSAAHPRVALDPVFFLPLEVLLQVVYYQCPLQGTPQPGQVFHKGPSDKSRVLTIQPVGDVFFVWVELVQYEVGVCLVGSGENDYLIR